MLYSRPCSLKIALGYQDNVGKNTFASKLSECSLNTRPNYWHKLSFAAPVNDLAHTIEQKIGVGPAGTSDQVRKLLTQGLKDIYYENIWKDLLLNEVRSILIRKSEDNIIVTDMKRRSEMRELEKLGFITIKIIRPSISYDTKLIHNSELANETFDFTLRNDEDLSTYDENIQRLFRVILWKSLRNTFDK